MTKRIVQQHLMMTTEGRLTLRSKAVGWSAEDPRTFVPGGGHERIGLSPGFRGPYSYSSPLAALADGWKLLAPPELIDTDSDQLHDHYDWWFVRDVETDAEAPGVR